MRARVLSSCLVSALLVSCRSSPAASHEGGPVREDQPGGSPVQVELLWQDPMGGIADELRLVVRDSAMWPVVWRRVIGGRKPAPPVPRVDFSTELVLVVAQGSRSSTGYSITIDSVVSEGQRMRAYVRSTAPGSGCLIGKAMTHPIHVSRIRPSTDSVAFEEVVERRPECR